MYYNAQAVWTQVLPRILVKYFKGLDFNDFFQRLGKKEKEKLPVFHNDMAIKKGQNLEALRASTVCLEYLK